MARPIRSMLLVFLTVVPSGIFAQGNPFRGVYAAHYSPHSFQATGITAYLKNSGKLEVAQHIANHESPLTTKLYDRRQDEISLDEIERIAI